MKGCKNLATFMARKGIKDMPMKGGDKKTASAEEDAADGGMDDAEEGPVAKKAKKGLKRFEKMG